jgi:hypothetical protein
MHGSITIPVSLKQISISRAPLTPLVSFFTTNAVSKYYGFPPFPDPWSFLYLNNKELSKLISRIERLQEKDKMP